MIILGCGKHARRHSVPGSHAIESVAHPAQEGEPGDSGSRTGSPLGVPVAVVKALHERTVWREQLASVNRTELQPHYLERDSSTGHACNLSFDAARPTLLHQLTTVDESFPPPLNSAQVNPKARPGELPDLTRGTGKKIAKLPSNTSVYLQGSAHTLYQQLAKETGYSEHQLRITKAGDGGLVPNDKSITLASAGLEDGGVIQVKDLGAFSTMYAAVASRQTADRIQAPRSHGRPSSSSSILDLYLFIRFSISCGRTSTRMHPSSRPPFKRSRASPSPCTFSNATNPGLTITALALYIFGEVANLNTHLVLRSLRSPGGTERGVPKGFGFDWVTCPNYLFETIAWTGILLLNKSWSTAVFIVITVAQMAAWAKKKEMRYRKEGGAKYQKKRYSMIPGIW
nr:putative enoyl reductase [Quercus suber]